MNKIVLFFQQQQQHSTAFFLCEDETVKMQKRKTSGAFLGRWLAFFRLSFLSFILFLVCFFFFFSFCFTSKFFPPLHEPPIATIAF
jgi:hypothetical protein